MIHRSAKTVSGWDAAIVEAQRQIAALRRSITAFKEYKELGVEFPEAASESDVELLGQEGELVQSHEMAR